MTCPRSHSKFIVEWKAVTFPLLLQMSIREKLWFCKTRVTYNVKILHCSTSLSKLCCEAVFVKEGWHTPVLKSQPCLPNCELSVTNHWTYVPGPDCSLPGCLVSTCRSFGPCFWGWVMGNEKNPEKSCHGNKGAVAAAMKGDLWLHTRQRVCLFAFHLGPPSFRACFRGMLMPPPPSSRSFLVWPPGLRPTRCQPPLANGQRQSRKLFGFHSLSSLDNSHIISRSWK